MCSWGMAGERGGTSQGSRQWSVLYMVILSPAQGLFSMKNTQTSLFCFILGIADNAQVLHTFASLLWRDHPGWDSQGSFHC